MKRALIALAAPLMLFGVGPASGDLFGGSIVHQDPDEGYDRPLLVDCAHKTGWQRLKEGVHSDWICGPNGQEDVNRLKLRHDGERITCYMRVDRGSMWIVFLDDIEDSPRSIANHVNMRCVNGLD